MRRSSATVGDGKGIVFMIGEGICETSGEVEAVKGDVMPMLIAVEGIVNGEGDFALGPEEASAGGVDRGEVAVEVDVGPTEGDEFVSTSIIEAGAELEDVSLSSWTEER